MNHIDVNIHPDWALALSDCFHTQYFTDLVTQIKLLKKNGTIIFPTGKNIFKAYDLCPPSFVKVVILGQDPYHNPDEAMGLSFSVPKHIKIPPSLRNIYKELQNDLGVIPALHGDLTQWATQGVFLLNAVLTVEKNKPASHKSLGWQNFTDATIQYLSDYSNNVVFMLWGNYAKTKRSLINTDKHLVLEAVHPSPLAGNGFQGCKHFSQANEYLIKHNKEPINWEL